MVGVFELWLPVLLSAVAVFVVSSVVHMVLGYHKKDLGKVPGEEAVLADLRRHQLPRGEYMFPCAGSMKEMGTPEFQAKLSEGPVGLLTVLPSGPINMGKPLGQWFVYSVVISFFVAYLATMGLERGASAGRVFQMTSTLGIFGHALSSIPNSIWKGAAWGTTARFIVDGVLYGLAIGAVFVWLWPAAA